MTSAASEQAQTEDSTKKYAPVNKPVFVVSAVVVCAFTLWAWLAPDAAQKAIFGATGTCRMGSNDDDMSPLDPQLRVKGINNLRVADASVMPQLTAVNPNITFMLIGERAAQLIAGE